MRLALPAPRRRTWVVTLLPLPHGVSEAPVHGCKEMDSQRRLFPHLLFISPPRSIFFLHWLLRVPHSPQLICLCFAYCVHLAYYICFTFIVHFLSFLSVTGDCIQLQCSMYFKWEDNQILPPLTIRRKTTRLGSSRAQWKQKWPNLPLMNATKQSAGLHI